MPILGGGSTVRAGTIANTASNNAPPGWLRCNGAAVSRELYAALFTEIGTTYGAGDGSTTFNLPDMRGEFLRGLDDGRGVDTGRAIGTAQTDAMQGHGHQTRNANSAQYTVGSGGYYSTAQATAAPDNSHLGFYDVGNGTPRTAGETRPRNRAMHYIIKF